MDYELAKELKDAGFPQTPASSLKSDGPIQTINGCYIPTLEELMQACGGEFCFVCPVFDERNGTTAWHALSQDMMAKGPRPVPTDPDSWKGTPSGATAIEALARLWLLLNKK